MKKGLSILFALAAITLYAQHLARPRVKLQPGPDVRTAACVDTLPEANVRVTGYTKPLRSNRESMVVRNCGDVAFDSLALTLTYTTDDGFMLNVRQITVPAHVTPGSVRTINIKSWDVNNSYYYFLNPPTRAAGTPYRLSLSALPIRCK